MKTALLSLKNISFTLDQVSIFHALNLDVHQGDIIGLLGRNGMGKSTLFKVILGLYGLQEGKIMWEGENIATDSVSERVNKGILYLPQENLLLDSLTVRDNLWLFLEYKSIPLTQKEKILQEVLNDMSLLDLQHKKVRYLSGGEKRRTALARSLLHKPKIILLDEPFAAVDPIVTQDIKKTIILLVQRGIAIIITDHSYQDVADISNKLYVLAKGSLIEQKKEKQIGKTFLDIYQ